MPASPRSDRPRPLVPPALRRRAFWLVGFSVSLGPALFALLWLGVRGRLPTPALWVVSGLLLLSAPALFVLLRPLAEYEAERAIAAAKDQRWTHAQWGIALLAGLSILATTVVLMYLLLYHEWRTPLARAAGIVAYFAVYLPLAQWHRCGIAPYWRPRWYGFLLAGVGGGAIWALAARTEAGDGIVGGVIWALMHYALVRLALRRVEQRHAA